MIDFNEEEEIARTIGPIGFSNVDLNQKTNKGLTGFGKEAVGSLASQEKGSGARFNAGKVAVDLIPVWIIAKWARDEYYRASTSFAPKKLEAIDILTALGEWQRGYLPASELLRMFRSDWINDCSAVFDYGRKKYAAWNWAKGMQWSVPTGCAVRHLLAILRGEENDVGPQGSGLPHRGHVACNLVMLAQYEQTFTEGDDRPVKWLAASKASDDGRKEPRVLLTEINPSYVVNSTPISDIKPDFRMPKFTSEGFSQDAEKGVSGIENLYPPPI